MAGLQQGGFYLLDLHRPQWLDLHLVDVELGEQHFANASRRLPLADARSSWPSTTSPARHLFPLIPPPHPHPDPYPPLTPPRITRYVTTPTGHLSAGAITRTPFVSPLTPWRTPMLFSVPWHTRGAVNLENTQDAADPGGPLHYADGTVFRVVDYPPYSTGPMHRTETLDYGVVVEGELVMQLDPIPGPGAGSGAGAGAGAGEGLGLGSGSAVASPATGTPTGTDTKGTDTADTTTTTDTTDTTTVRAGDIILQRGTFHAWHNRTPHWARMAYVLVAARPATSPQGPLRDAIRLGAREVANDGLVGSVFGMVMRVGYVVGRVQGYAPGWGVEASGASGRSVESGSGAGGDGAGGGGSGPSGEGGAGGGAEGETSGKETELGTLYTTGHDLGLAVITSRTPLRPGQVWRTGPLPVSNDNGGEGGGAGRGEGANGGEGEGGTVCRVLEIAPGETVACPQTAALGYAVVLSGTPTLLDRTLTRGDVAVLRGKAVWGNSGTKVARVVVVEVA